MSDLTTLDRSVAELRAAAKKAGVYPPAEAIPYEPKPLEQIPDVDRHSMPALSALLFRDAGNELYYSLPLALLALAGIIGFWNAESNAVLHPRYLAMGAFGYFSFRCVARLRILSMRKTAWRGFLHHLSRYGDPAALASELNEQLPLTTSKLTIMTKDWILNPEMLHRYQVAPIWAIREFVIASGIAYDVQLRCSGGIRIQLTDEKLEEQILRRRPDLTMENTSSLFYQRIT